MTAGTSEQKKETNSHNNLYDVEHVKGKESNDLSKQKDFNRSGCAMIKEHMKLRETTFGRCVEGGDRT
jgi:hypothetical protein